MQRVHQKFGVEKLKAMEMTDMVVSIGDRQLAYDLVRL